MSGSLQLCLKYSSTTSYSVSQIPNNKSLKEQKATKSVRDNNPDVMKQTASKKGVSASLRDSLSFVTALGKNGK